MKKRLVVANWKMYIASADEAKKFAGALKRKLAKLPGVDVWVAPPATLVSVLGKGPYKVGGQAASPYTSGAHTGEVSAKMLKLVGATFCIVGHSERRIAGQSDEAVRSELLSVLDSGLVGILCIGEVERREDGAHFAHIESQLRSALPRAHLYPGKIIIAYEPVWAIGKSAAEAMQPQALEEMVIFIKKTLSQALGREAGLKVPILYGGSVEGQNAKALLASGVSGFLVGHASSEIDSFTEILKACQK